VLFSIIIPTYNRPDLLKRAVKSVLVQTYENYELIVVNDGSTKQYDKVLTLFSENKSLRYFYINNSGPSAARNFGIDVANGEFVCFLDDDDEFLPDHLQTIYERIEKEKFAKGIYRTLAYFVSGDEIKKQNFVPQPEEMPSMERLYANIMLPCTVAVSKDILHECKFDVTIPISEDFDLWTRILLNYPFYEENKITARYNLHSGSTSAGDEESIHKKHIQAFRKIFSEAKVKKRLPQRIRVTILHNRYLWLANARLRKHLFIEFIWPRIMAFYYSVLLRIIKIT